MIASLFCSNELFVTEHVTEQMSHQSLRQRLQHSERLKNHSWIMVQNYKREMQVFNLNKSNVSVLFHAFNRQCLSRKQLAGFSLPCVLYYKHFRQRLG